MSNSSTPYDDSFRTLLTDCSRLIIPFYFFNFDLQEMDALPAKIAEMKELYRNLWDKLDSLVDQEKISEFGKCAIKAMCDKVASSLADNFSNVKEGVEDIMGGQILDYEAKRIARETEKRTEIKANINAVVNMFSIGVSEEQIKKCYPDQFEEGKALYLEQCDELKEM